MSVRDKIYFFYQILDMFKYLYYKYYKPFKMWGVKSTKSIPLIISRKKCCQKVRLDGCFGDVCRADPSFTDGKSPSNNRQPAG